MAKEEKKMTGYKDYPVGTNGRINFSKISGSAEIPYLAEIQTKSFEWFKQKGLDEVFKESFPIENFGQTIQIDYLSSEFDEPALDPLGCKATGASYSSKLHVQFRIKFKNGEFKDEKVYMGEVPMMTDSGTFIINGDERVIVSQIVRSPGAYFEDIVDKSGAHTYGGEIFPSRGTWLDFESDQKGILWVRIDRQRKMPATVLLKAIGITSDKQIKDLFGDVDVIKNTLKKDSDNKTAIDALVDIFKKLKPGEPVTEDGVHTFLVQKFFDEKHYDAGRAGRYKYAKKLGLYDRLAGRILAEDLISADGEILFTNGTKLTKEDVQKLKDMEFFENGAHKFNLKLNERLDKSSNTINKVLVYAHDKVGEKIIPVIGTDLNLSLARITLVDVIATFSYFCGS